MKVFLSHSSKDKELARKISIDLVNKGVDVWFDEWEIFVGDSITNKIQSGLSESKLLIVFLSKDSIKSGWVEKEWQSKMENEAITKKVTILPLKVDNTPMPQLLKDKKYADFNKNYDAAFNDLLLAIKIHIDPAISIRNNIHSITSLEKEENKNSKIIQNIIIQFAILMILSYEYIWGEFKINKLLVINDTITDIDTTEPLISEETMLIIFKVIFAVIVIYIVFKLFSNIIHFLKNMR
ncbi:toll/interleukin-1 receptor domain-containing protein [Thiothrix unzii]|jgi:hypothetical protein|uniref:toll/interleukin-1 receptor domain-containing protein n=1 Tax=Thiothrix unzii TaxID=111769 RepID=UPI002A35B891|nr:toll/interleukin-1 receptor domain-containing protein [Thiothrix unzii]MDX9988720.1 toll/interleukin-1 receptor domain-containing protein [Thiothrix unzii]